MNRGRTELKGIHATRPVFAAAACGAALLLLAALSLFLCGASSGKAGVSSADAKAEAARLMERVGRVSERDPSDAGAAPAWSGATPGQPLEVRTPAGRPAEYIVPVVDRSGKTVSTIGVDGRTGVWNWYSRRYPFRKFPLVSAEEAVRKVKRFLKSVRMSASVKRPRAMVAPDKVIYWRIEFEGGSRLREAYLPAFIEEEPLTDLETAPWKRTRVFDGDAAVSAGRDADRPAVRPEPSRGDLALPAQHDIEGVPYHRQKTDYWCGPASLEMMFDYWGPDISQSEIASVAGADPSVPGCYDDDLARAGHFSRASASVKAPTLRGYTGRSLGYGVATKKWSEGSSAFGRRYGDLKSLVAAGYPVLVLSWYDASRLSGHFRLVKGYSDSTGAFIFHDPWFYGFPSGPDCALNQRFFVDDLWDYSGRWGMIAAPWNVVVDKPDSVAAGETFRVDALISYRGPKPMEGQFPCGDVSAVIELPPPDYTLVGGDAAGKPVSGLVSTGSSGSASWTVRANVDKSDTGDIAVTAQGSVRGSSGKYPGYTDLIGGSSRGGGRIGNTFYFAEGCTRPGYETWICIQNPSGTDANVQITYMLGSGQNFDQEVTVAAHSRGTVSVNDFILRMTDPYQDVSARVTCTNGVEIIAERPMYFDADGIRGGHVAVGVGAAGNVWYFAEGNTYDWNRQWLCLQNPGSTDASVTVDYMLADGSVLRRGYGVTARSRGTIDVNAALSPFKGDVSMRVESDVPIIAERPMYFLYRGRWPGGSDATGASAPHRTWHFAEGNTRAMNDMWLCLQNPDDGVATVKVDYRFFGGAGKSRSYSVAGHSRFTVNVNEEVGPGVDLGMSVESDIPVIAERSMYFDYHGKWAGGDDVLGCNEPKSSWFLAEGCTRYEADSRFETWICILNPGDVDATAIITYMLSSGPTVSREYRVKAASRLTVDVNGDVGPGHDVSAMVTATAPVIVERPMYFYQNGNAGGHTVMAY